MSSQEASSPTPAVLKNIKLHHEDFTSLIDPSQSSTPQIYDFQCTLNSSALYNHVKTNLPLLIKSKRYFIWENNKQANLLLPSNEKKARVQTLLLKTMNLTTPSIPSSPISSSSPTTDSSTPMAESKQLSIEELYKLSSKWKKRKAYSIFSEMNDHTRPDYWIVFAHSGNSAQFITSIIEGMENEERVLICRFFELEDMLKNTVRERTCRVLIDFFTSLVVNGSSEEEARACLQFSPPLFLNSKSKLYIGPLYTSWKKTIKKEELCMILYLLNEFAKSSAGKTDENAIELVQQQEGQSTNSQQLALLKELLKENNLANEDVVISKLKTNEIFTTAAGNSYETFKQQHLNNSTKNQVNEELIKTLSQGAKNILSLPSTENRDEFHSEIRDKAWLKCTKLNCSKQIPEIDNYFKLDMYNGVVSIHGISGGPTGIQLDHIFPDKLGGPNTLANAACIHWRANNIKSDTPLEFLLLQPDGKDWFNEIQFIECVKLYGIWCIGKKWI